MLVRRGTQPFYGHWSIPGSFIQMEESAQEAARRTLLEKTHVSQAHLEQLYTFSRKDRDPRNRVISIAYLALVPAEHLSFLRGPGILDADLFAIRQEAQKVILQSPEGEILPVKDLAFDHGEIVTTALARMRGKIWYTDIAFSLMNDPSAFTLPELQTAFEAILGSPLDAGNFYRKIKHDYLHSGRIEDTGAYGRTVGKKKATLYRFIQEPATDPDAKDQTGSE